MPLLLVFAEVMLIYYFVQFYGFFNLVLFYFVTTFLGILILRIAGAKSLKQFQMGQVTQASSSMLSQGLLFLSGLMLIIPSLFSKVLGALLTLPPVRWLTSYAFMGFLLKRVFNNDGFIHQFGNNGFKFYYSNGGNPFQNRATPDVANSIEDSNVIEADFRTIQGKKRN